MFLEPETLDTCCWDPLPKTLETHLVCGLWPKDYPKKGLNISYLDPQGFVAAAGSALSAGGLQEVLADGSETAAERLSTGTESSGVLKGGGSKGEGYLRLLGEPRETMVSTREYWGSLRLPAALGLLP